VSTEQIRTLIAVGIFMMLLLLRLEAGRFGAAEYDEPGRKSGSWTRISWYAIGGLLLAAMYVVHPSPNDTLTLVVGHRYDTLVVGLALAALGIGQAALFARFHYGYLRLPPLRAYPNAAVNAIGTAVIDEAVFRGALLGTLLSLGMPAVGAILEATIVYLLATRLSAGRHHPYVPVLAAGMGLVFGWATVVTGGLGAAIFAHAVTSFAVFAFTGHAGQVAPAGDEPEDVAARRAIPEGWEDARHPSLPGRGAEPKGTGEPDGR
jgi:membrane protease YdiL (CAAX protease family)